MMENTLELLNMLKMMMMAVKLSMNASGYYIYLMCTNIFFISVSFNSVFPVFGTVLGKYVLEKYFTFLTNLWQST